MSKTLIIFFGVLATFVSIAHGYKCPIPGTEDEYVKFFLHGDEKTEIKLGDKATLDKIDPNKNLKIYAHGFLESPDNEDSSTSVVIRSFKKHQDNNLISVDWSSLAGESLADYPLLSECTKLIVGPFTGKLLNFLYYEGGIPAKNFHLIGFGTGAHLLGVAAGVAEFNVPHITGLDPSGPLFDEFAPDDQKLTKDDADLVEIFFTNCNSLGTITLSGHYNFFLNGGYNQPGCPENDKAINLSRQGVINNFLNAIKTVIGDKYHEENSSKYSSADFCSHNHVIKIFSVALDPTQVTTGQKCESKEEAVYNQCKGAPIPVSLYEPYPAEGIYYIKCEV